MRLRDELDRYLTVDQLVDVGKSNRALIAELVGVQGCWRLTKVEVLGAGIP